MNRGIATFTLDHGRCPPWLFRRMVKLGRPMTEAIVAEFGAEEYIRRLGDPVWFQALGTVLAFDWNASGLTTILTAALKESIRGQEADLGVFICGGKGKTSLKTPDQIQAWGQRLNFKPQQVQSLTYNSRMSAKVDSALVQDGYQIYHHSFFFSKSGAWTVVQQGMNTSDATARRYHWHSNQVSDLICEPHSGIAAQRMQLSSLNLAAKASSKNRQFSLNVLAGGLQPLNRDFQILARHANPLSQMVKLKQSQDTLTLLNLDRGEFSYHPVVREDFSKNKYLQKILTIISENVPENYENLLATPGVGPKTVRALSLVSEVVYGAKPSYQDPARYSFAHGGKDGTPYPVDRGTYDQTISIFSQLVERARFSPADKTLVLRRLSAQQSRSNRGLTGTKTI